LEDFLNTFKYQVALKFFQWETSSSVQTDGRTDITKLIVAFPNFVKVLKIWKAEIFSFPAKPKPKLP